MGPLKRLIHEIHRRSLWQVLGIYGVASWVVLQVVDTLTDTLSLPQWFPPFAFVLLLIGLPVVLATAFVQKGVGSGPPGGLSESQSAGTAQPGGQETRASAAGTAPGTAPLSSSESSLQRLFTWRNAWLGGVGALALWGLAVAGWMVLGPGAGALGEVGRARGAGAGSNELDRSIAVLPFRNLSGDAEAEPFVNGIHEDVLTRLSKIGELKVISRTSVDRYRETEKSLPEIAGELGVAWIVEGGVQRAGDRVRLNAQLIDPRTDEHVWAESYDRQLSLDNIFDIQSDLARRIAEALQTELTPEDTRRMATGSTGSLEAYELYQRGRFALSSRTAEGVRRRSISSGWPSSRIPCMPWRTRGSPTPWGWAGSTAIRSATNRWSGAWGPRAGPSSSRRSWRKATPRWAACSIGDGMPPERSGPSGAPSSSVPTIL